VTDGATGLSVLPVDISVSGTSVSSFTYSGSDTFTWRGLISSDSFDPDLSNNKLLSNTVII
jgi:hypothetical protein